MAFFVIPPRALRADSLYNFTVGTDGHTSVLLEDGTLLLLGGQDGLEPPVASVQGYDPITDTLVELGELNEPRAAHGSVLLADGTVLVFGGYDGTLTLDTLEVFDPLQGTSELLSETLLLPRAEPEVVVLSDGRIYLRGGWNDEGALETSEIIEPSTLSITSGSSIDPLTFPLIQTDKPDYVPDEVVTISGSGWTPYETVWLLMDEEPLLYPPTVLSAEADEEGDILNTDFVVQSHHVGTEFLLTALGETSGWRVPTTFTDGSVLLITALYLPGQNGLQDFTVSVGHPFTLRSVVTNHSTLLLPRPAFENVTVDLHLPDGWELLSDEPTPFTLPPSDSETIEWEVAPPDEPDDEHGIWIHVEGEPTTGYCSQQGILCEDEIARDIAAVSPAEVHVDSVDVDRSYTCSQISVTMSVTNQGGAVAEDVFPTGLVTVATGASEATECATSSIPVALEADEEDVFEYVCSVEGVGSLVFGGEVSWIDENDRDASPAPESEDGVNSEEVAVRTTYYYDADHDGYGDLENASTECPIEAGYVPYTDCDDSDASIHLGIAGVCFHDDELLAFSERPITDPPLANPARGLSPRLELPTYLTAEGIPYLRAEGGCIREARSFCGMDPGDIIASNAGYFGTCGSFGEVLHASFVECHRLGYSLNSLMLYLPFSHNRVLGSGCRCPRSVGVPMEYDVTDPEPTPHDLWEDPILAPTPLVCNAPPDACFDPALTGDLYPDMTWYSGPGLGTDWFDTVATALTAARDTGAKFRLTYEYLPSYDIDAVHVLGSERWQEIGGTWDEQDGIVIGHLDTLAAKLFGGAADYRDVIALVEMGVLGEWAPDRVTWREDWQYPPMAEAARNALTETLMQMFPGKPVLIRTPMYKNDYFDADDLAYTFNVPAPTPLDNESFSLEITPAGEGDLECTPAASPLVTCPKTLLGHYDTAFLHIQNHLQTWGWSGAGTGSADELAHYRYLQADSLYAPNVGETGNLPYHKFSIQGEADCTPTEELASYARFAGVAPYELEYENLYHCVDTTYFLKKELEPTENKYINSTGGPTPFWVFSQDTPGVADFWSRECKDPAEGVTPQAGDLGCECVDEGAPCPGHTYGGANDECTWGNCVCFHGQCIRRYFWLPTAQTVHQAGARTHFTSLSGKLDANNPKINILLRYLEDYAFEATDGVSSSSLHTYWWNSFANRLGYRLIASLTVVGEQLLLSFMNLGYAAPFERRQVELVFGNGSPLAEVDSLVLTDLDIRLLLPSCSDPSLLDDSGACTGGTVYTAEIPLEALAELDLSPGTYRIGIRIHNPEDHFLYPHLYHIRLMNATGLNESWEDDSGINWLTRSDALEIRAP